MGKEKDPKIEPPSCGCGRDELADIVENMTKEDNSPEEKDKKDSGDTGNKKDK